MEWGGIMITDGETRISYSSIFFFPLPKRLFGLEGTEQIMTHRGS